MDDLEGSCANTDGVIVLPEYRCYGLKKISKTSWEDG